MAVAAHFSAHFSETYNDRVMSDPKDEVASSYP